MAIVAGEEVAYAQPAANTSYSNRNGNFAFGIATTGDVDVLWENGTESTAIPDAQLDKIAAVDASTLLGRVLRITAANSPEYDGILVRAYTRQLEGLGDLVPYVLLRLLSTGQLLEVPAGQVAVVNGR